MKRTRTADPKRIVEMQLRKKYNLDSYPAVCPYCRNQIHLYSIRRINSGQEWICPCQKPKAKPSDIRASLAVLMAVAVAHPLHR